VSGGAGVDTAEGRRGAVARFAASLPFLLVACTPKPFAIVGLDVGAPEGAKLNQPLIVTFNDEVDPGSVREGTVRVVHERDGAIVPGNLRVEGSTVTFLPKLPLAADLSDVAFQPGERYRVEVPGLPVMRSLRGLDKGALVEGTSLTFRAISIPPDQLAEAPAERLFVDPVPGAPQIERGDRGEEPVLSRSGRVTLSFLEPLDPRGFAKVRFWLIGAEWNGYADPDRERRKKKNTAMTARLVENQERAVVELTIAEPTPKPLASGFEHGVIYDPQLLRDFAGHRPALRETDDGTDVKLKLEE